MPVSAAVRNRCHCRTPINTPADHAWLLKADSVFGARSEQTHAGWLVLVQGGKILAVGPPAEVHAPVDAQTIDLPGMTMLPGLIDAHSHIFLHPYNETLWNDQVLKESQSSPCPATPRPISAPWSTCPS
jgi:imidazolonepropionase-like amidohydrolase